jgi:hypothetical protein
VVHGRGAAHEALDGPIVTEVSFDDLYVAMHRVRARRPTTQDADRGSLVAEPTHEA